MSTESTTEFGTIVGPDAFFKGELTFETGAKVLGKIEGSINSKGRIHIADGARCKAQVKAKEIAVEGQIEGNVEATERVDLKPKGAITGDVTAATMTMAEGATLDGHCRIGVSSQAGQIRPGIAAEPKPSGVVQPNQQHVHAGRR